MKKIFIYFGLAILGMSCSNNEIKSNQEEIKQTEEITMDKSIYNFNYETPSGEKKSMNDYNGNVILIVNTATQCGLTPQFEGLELLHNTYAEKGLKVLGFPCNQFGGQEPLTNEEMVETCKINHGVTFELTKKIEVNGENENSLYSFLKGKQKLEDENDIRWNFEKFLVNKKGEVVKRFSPQTTPAEITNEIEELL